MIVTIIDLFTAMPRDGGPADLSRIENRSNNQRIQNNRYSMVRGAFPQHTIMLFDVLNYIYLVPQKIVGQGSYGRVVEYGYERNYDPSGAGKVTRLVYTTICTI